MSDYVRLPRDAVNDDLWKMPYVGQLYFYLLKKADEKGEWKVSFKEVQRDLGLSRQQYRTAMEVLKATTCITASATASVTTITLDISTSKAESTTTSITASAATPTTTLQTGYDRFLQYFNSKVEHTPIRTIRTLSETRKRMLRSISKEFGGREAIEEALEKVVKSQWCCGGNDKGWIASFDWIFKKSNFIKILEGNYDDRTESRNEDKYGTRRGTGVGDVSETDYYGTF